MPGSSQPFSGLTIQLAIAKDARKQEFSPKVSGFTFVRNAMHLNYPVVESRQSILPLCNEFVIAAGDSSDGTTEALRAVGSPKLRIIETTSEPDQFVRGAIFAQHTNIALDACNGVDWDSQSP